jgi:hypothetical protein
VFGFVPIFCVAGMAADHHQTSVSKKFETEVFNNEKN